jgi:cephalosporin hydroxylase
MDEVAKFQDEVRANITAMSHDNDLQARAHTWMRDASRYKFTYNYRWMGRPIIQTPEDMVAMQELIWQIQPDLIIETGIAHGGSLVFYASMLELLGGNGRVLGIDIDIRAHNRAEIEKHPMAKRITMIQGSAVDPAVFEQVRAVAKGQQRVLVALDSNHTHDHVLRELQLYAPLVTKGSYCVVFDTLVEDMPDDLFGDRPWGKGNNPKTAVWAYLKTTDRFEIDALIPAKLQFTVAPDGYLRCIKD